MSNWFGNIFGSIANRVVPLPVNLDFIPTGADGDVTRQLNVLFLKQNEPNWLGLASEAMQFWAYCFCSPLSAVIDRCAEADINGEIQFLKDDGSDDYSNSAFTRKMKKLFKRPNPLQTWYEFRAQQVVFKKVFGYAPVFVMNAAGFEDKSDASYLWNLNPYYARPVKSEKFSLFANEQYVKQWNITINGIQYELPSDEVFLLKDGYIDRVVNDYFLPISKVYGLDWAVSNICAAMEADNVLLKKKGPLGFISHDPKPDNVAGYIPMSQKQKKEIQDNLQQYGLTWSQWQYVISKLPIRWNPMSFNIRDLMTKETIREAIDMICDRYNYPAELMSGKNATYENRTSAEKFFYQNNVIPSSLRDMVQYDNFFGMGDNGVKYIIDYSKLPVLQEDIVRQGEANNYNAQANLILFQNSVITLNQFRTSMGIDTVDGDDIYFEDATKKYGNGIAALKAVPPANNKTNPKKEAA